MSIQEDQSLLDAAMKVAQEVMDAAKVEEQNTSYADFSDEFKVGIIMDIDAFGKIGKTAAEIKNSLLESYAILDDQSLDEVIAKYTAPEKPKPTFNELAPEQALKVVEKIKEMLAKLPPGQGGLLDTPKLAEEMGISYDQSLYDAIHSIIKAQPAKGHHFYHDASPVDKEHIKQYIGQLIEEGTTDQAGIVGKVVAAYGVNIDDELQQQVQNILSWVSPKEKGLKLYTLETLPVSKINAAKAFIKKKAMEGVLPSEISVLTAKQFHLVLNDPLVKWVDEVITFSEVTKPEPPKKPLTPEAVVNFIKEHTPKGKSQLWYGPAIWADMDEKLGYETFEDEEDFIEYLDSLISQGYLKKTVEGLYYGLPKPEPKKPLNEQAIIAALEAMVGYTAKWESIVNWLEEEGYVWPEGAFVDLMFVMEQKGKVIKIYPSGDYTLPADSEPAAPSTLDEHIVTLVNYGWSKEAILGYLAGKADPKDLAYKVNKLHPLYHKETKAQLFSQMPGAFKKHMQDVALNMLSKGKTVADTAWYISFHYHLDKKEIGDMVRNQSRLPLEKVAEMVALIQSATKVGDKIGGCLVEQPLTNLKPTVVAYCQGALTEPAGYTAVIDSPGDMGSQKTPHQAISFVEDGSDGQFKLKLARSVVEGKAQEMAGVAKVLAEMHFQPAMQYPTASKLQAFHMTGEDGGKLSISNQDKIRNAALFLSMADPVQALEDKCIPAAVQYAHNWALQAGKTSKPWTNLPYPGQNKEDWEKLVCAKVS